MWLLLALACAPPPEAPGPAPTVPAAPAPPPPRPTPATDGPSLAAYLAGPHEYGACRDGKLRKDGIVVADARDPAAAALLAGQLAAGPVASRAIAAGLLWEARAELPAEHADALASLFAALFEADTVEGWQCRELKRVVQEGHIWNARSDVLGVISRLQPPGPARAAEAAGALRPDQADVVLAAIDDAGARDRIGGLAFAQLCTGRTWETTYLLRALDTGRKGSSLTPLSAFEANQCPKDPAP